MKMFCTICLLEDYVLGQSLIENPTLIYRQHIGFAPIPQLATQLMFVIFPPSSPATTTPATTASTIAASAAPTATVSTFVSLTLLLLREESEPLARCGGRSQA